MKTIAVFYEPETKENYCEEKKVLEIICRETTESEHAAIRNDYLSTHKYNKALSFCWWLPNDQANEIYERVKK